MAVTPGQERQGNWKSLRTLPEHPCERDLPYSTLKPLSNSSSTTASVALFSVPSIRTQDKNNILKSWSNGGFNKSTRSRNRADAIPFKAKTVGNPHLARLTWSQSRYTVSSTFRPRELSMRQAKSYLKCLARIGPADDTTDG